MVVAEQHVATSLRAEVVEAGARFSAGQRRLVHLVAALDASGEWALDGSPTCAHWVAEALGVEVCTAREWLRIGAALVRLDVVDDAFTSGRLSYSKVRAVTRVATPENQRELCDIAERTPAGRLGCALASWLSRRETPEETEARQHAGRSFSARIDVDGMGFGSFRLPPAEFAVLMAALDTRVRLNRPRASADASNGERAWPSVAQQRADALIELAHGTAGEVVTEVVVHVRGDGCTMDDGTPIPQSVVENIAPAAFLRTLIHDAEGRPINASSRRRHPSARQRRVVHERDRVCVDCGSTELLEYDHVPDYEQTRRTRVEELRMRCSSCHHRRHRKSAGGVLHTQLRP
jgi:hypothetical protein